MAIQTVGIVGAGQMGNGIAHVFALSGYDVLMNDVSAESLSKALATIDRNIERQVSRGKVTSEAKAAAMARIKTSLTIADLGSCVVNGPGESKNANIGISLPGSGESPVAPVFEDGVKTVTLKGDKIAEEFQTLVERYIESHYGAH